MSIFNTILDNNSEPIPDHAFRLITEQHAVAKRQRQRAEQFADKRRSADEHDYLCERGIFCDNCLTDSFEAVLVADEQLPEEWVTWER